MTKKLTKAQLAAQALALQATETPVVETPVVETPVVETPVVETPVVEEAPVDLGTAMTNLVTVKTHKVVKTVKTGVGKQILQHIADGVLSNKEIVARVLEDNPLRKTTYACVAWYKSQVAAGKMDLPEPQEEVMMTEEELAEQEDQE